MNRFREIFPKDKVFLPVIHVEERNQALRNVGIAIDAGANGVFLIGHGMPSFKLTDIYLEVVDHYPSFWTGINYLDLTPLSSIHALVDTPADGLWVDDGGIREGVEDSVAGARRVRESQLTNGVMRALLFGGVAFKHQQRVSDVAVAAQVAVPFMDVITTSGPATGVAADPKKIKRMRGAIGDHPLAIASGITSENLHLYTPFVDCFMVATGVSSSHTELDPSRVESLVKALLA